MDSNTQNSNEKKESTPPFIRNQRQMDEANKNLRLEERVRHELFSNNSKAKNNFPNLLMKSESNKNVHKRQESDSKLSFNFVRGFRRENSDFFPLSKRHSAVLGERQSSQPIAQAVQRSSAIFQRNRNKGEPVLTDFITKRENNLNNNNVACKLSSSSISHNQQQLPNRNSDFLRPRREKTESNIIVRNSTTRQLLLEQQVMDIKIKIFKTKRKILLKQKKIITRHAKSCRLFKILK